jgi:hypothetical protein
MRIFFNSLLLLYTKIPPILLGGISFLVRKKGLEPPRREAPDPKSGAATNYATSASRILYFQNNIGYFGMQIYHLHRLIQMLLSKKYE